MFLKEKQSTVALEEDKNSMKSFSYGGVIMKKKHVITITAVLAASMAMSVTAFGAPTDIQGHWAQNTINKWVDKGDISGYPDGTFRPNNMITRAEFVVLVNNAMGYSKSGYAYFSDVPNHYWGKNAIQTGVAAGYISGDGDGTFRPNDPVTRQEAAAMISRILGLKQNDSRAYRYTDSYAISNWAKGVVGAVSEAGIMAGYPDGSFGPNKVLTRAEAVLALDKTMNYKPGDKEEDKEETKKEDMLLTQSKLEDTTVTGDLTISDRLGTKTITLEDVTVKGKLIVDGGGEIILRDCNIKEMVMDQKDTAVKASGKTTVEKTTFKKIGKLTGGDYTDVVVDKELSGSITIDAKVRNLTLDAETDLKLGSDARIKNMEITKNADKATIDFSKAKVEDMVVKDKISIRGSGDIDTMTVYVSDVNTSIRPDTVKTKDGASKPNYTDDNDDWYKPSRYRNVTVDRNYSGGTYRSATVTKSGITAKNMTVRENLYIDSDVKDGSVTLEGMTVYGNVYVKGGGENSVYFKDCKISGHIYAEKTYDKYPVGLKLDNKTVQALKGNLYIRGNGADVMGLESDNGTYLKRIVVETSNPVELTDLQAERVDITAANADVKIPAPTVVKELYVTDKGNGKIELSGTIGKLQADNAITVKGSGRIDEKSGKVEVTEDVKIGVTSVTLDKTETYDVNWCEATFRRMLKDKLAIGVYNKNGRYNNDFCPPVISKEQFEHVQELLRRNSRHNPAGRVYIFTGILVCEECRHHLVGRKQKDFFYYRCNQHFQRGRCTHNHSAREDVIETWLFEHLGEEIKKYEVAWNVQAAERKRTAASIDRSVLRRKLTKLKDLYMNDLIDIDEYKKDYETYTAALSALEEPEEEKHIDLSGVHRIISHDFREIYDSLTREEKRTLWKNTLKEIRVNNANEITGISFF